MKDDKGAVIKGHPVKVLAKSGTLNFVSGLAGHIVPPPIFWDGRELVFAIFSGDPERRDAVPVSLARGAGGRRRLDQAGAPVAGPADQPLGRALRLIWRQGNTPDCSCRGRSG
jgi:hypothetical protein